MGDAEKGLQAARAAYESANKNFGDGGRDNLMVETQDVFGRALVDSGELEEGIRHLRESIAGAERLLGPNADSVVSKLSWLARAQTRLGDLNGAIETLERAVKASKDPLNRSRVQAALGIALTSARRASVAVEQLKPALATMRRLDTTGTAWIGNATSAYGNALALAGHNDEAQRLLKENLAGKLLGLAAPESHNGLGIVALNRNDYAAARQHFEKGLELSSEGPPSRVLVASLLGLAQTDLAVGDFAAAEDAVQKAEAAQQKVAQRPTPVLIDILATRARLAAAQGRDEQAAELFAQIDEFSPEFNLDSRYGREAAQRAQKAPR